MVLDTLGNNSDRISLPNVRLQKRFEMVGLPPGVNHIIGWQEVAPFSDIMHQSYIYSLKSHFKLAANGNATRDDKGNNPDVAPRIHNWGEAVITAWWAPQIGLAKAREFVGGDLGDTEWDGGQTDSADQRIARAKRNVRHFANIILDEVAVVEQYAPADTTARTDDRDQETSLTEQDPQASTRQAVDAQPGADKMLGTEDDIPAVPRHEDTRTGLLYRPDRMNLRVLQPARLQTVSQLWWDKIEFEFPKNARRLGIEDYVQYHSGGGGFINTGIVNGAWPGYIIWMLTIPSSDIHEEYNLGQMLNRTKLNDDADDGAPEQWNDFPLHFDSDKNNEQDPKAPGSKLLAGDDWDDYRWLAPQRRPLDGSLNFEAQESGGRPLDDAFRQQALQFYAFNPDDMQLFKNVKMDLRIMRDITYRRRAPVVGTLSAR